MTIHIIILSNMYRAIDRTNFYLKIFCFAQIECAYKLLCPADTRRSYTRGGHWSITVIICHYAVFDYYRRCIIMAQGRVMSPRNHRLHYNEQIAMR